MVVEVRDATVSSVWAETFKGRDGEDVEFYRALVVVNGEAPMQLGVRKDDFEQLQSCIGMSGDLMVEIDARPGNRARVYLRAIA